ncbi:MAG TPA: hypothetical protein VMV04_16920 [Thermodesulfobacteriota bacterium]|nr:hypothetical protein [Thermodesulfobacteriota bacterium]
MRTRQKGGKKMWSSMKHAIVLAFLVILVSFSKTYALPGDTISIHSLPGGYEGGLAWDGTNFWGTRWTNNIVFQFDIDISGNSNIIKSLSILGGFLTGIAWDGSSLWVSDGIGGTGHIYHMDTSGTVLSSFSSPGGGGLAWDGKYLWQSDYLSDTIWQIDTSGNIVSSFKAPTPSSPCYPCGFSALTFDGTHLYYVNNWDENGTIYQIDRAGKIISFFRAPVVDAVGITWDGNSLWLSSSLGLYQIEGGTASPKEMIGLVQEFFDIWVSEGGLKGSGPGNSGKARLKAIGARLQDSETLIDKLCQQLLDIYNSTDGNPSPPDYVVGDAIPVLAREIQILRTGLGCP